MCGDVRDDTQLSLLFGILLGVMLATLLTLFPGEPFDFKDESEAAQDQPGLVLNEKKLDDKCKNAERLFGIPRNLFKNAIIQATNEHNNSEQQQKSQHQGSSTIPITLLSFGALFIAICYIYGSPGRGKSQTNSTTPTWVFVLARLFPREARTLGFSFASSFDL